MATLGELLAFLAPDAPAPAGADVAVSWVRVLRARVPALDVLEPGDLVIVPATSLDVVAPAPADLRDLAQTLARSGASGLLLVPAVAVNPAFAAQEGLAARDVLGELEAEAREAGLAAVRVERIDTPALERRLIGYLVDRRGELERQAAVLEGDLAKLAMAVVGREVEIACDRDRVRPDHSEVMALICNNEKAKALAGWEPHVSLRDGLSRCAEFVREHPELFKPDEYSV